MPSKKTKPAKGNVATVYDGAFEIRTFTKEVHGDNFAELAKRFAVPRNMKVVVSHLVPQVKGGVTCPECGHTFKLK